MEENTVAAAPAMGREAAADFDFDAATVGQSILRQAKLLSSTLGKQASLRGSSSGSSSNSSSSRNYSARYSASLSKALTMLEDFMVRVFCARSVCSAFDVMSAGLEIVR